MFVFDWWSSLTRRGRDGTLLVDDQDVVSGQSGGPLRMLNVKGSLFLGKNTTELLEMSWGKNHLKIKVESVPGQRSEVNNLIWSNSLLSLHCLVISLF